MGQAPEVAATARDEDGPRIAEGRRTTMQRFPQIRHIVATVAVLGLTLALAQPADARFRRPPGPGPGEEPPTNYEPEPAAPVENHQMVFDAQASAITEAVLYLRAGQTATIETRDLSAGGDTILHLLAPSGTQVAVNDDASGSTRASRVVYAAPSGGFYRVVVRSKTPASAGVADLYLDGAPWLAQNPFGGMRLVLPGLRAGEEIESIRLPNGAGPQHVLYLLSGHSIAERRRGNATLGGANLQLQTDLGTRVVVVGSVGAPGPVRVVRNDVSLTGHDGDADGLGLELERDLNTCRVRGGTAGSFDCSTIADARDTDGDGISDGWEVLGRRDGTPHQALPLWGADPRHKDVFVEVDFMERNAGEAARRMPPAAARDFARAYGDVHDPGPATSSVRAAALRNPDGRRGVAVHLDTGVPPESPEDATVYGDWGGYNVVPRVSEGMGANYRTAWRTHMHPMRRGIFHHDLAPAGGGGQVELGSFSWTHDIGNGRLGAHESGHGFGLGHSGPAHATGDIDPNCKPNYPSPMNYGFLYGDVSFSDGRSAPALNNASLVEHAAIPAADRSFFDVLEEDFGYNVDRNAGHVDWNRDGSIAPAGETVRAYANHKPGEACEYTRYNQVDLTSSRTDIAPATARLHGSTHLFYVEDGQLKFVVSDGDWDCPQPAAAGCAGSSFGGERVTPYEGVEAFDVARIVPEPFGDQLLVVWRDARGILREGRMAPSGAWTAPRTITGYRVTGEPSLSSPGSGWTTVLAVKDTSHNVRVIRLVRGEWGPVLSARQPDGSSIRMAEQASPAVDFAITPHVSGWRLYGAFADAQGRLDLYAFEEDGRWHATEVLDKRVPVKGRPAMALVPYDRDSSRIDRLYLAYVHGTTDEVRWMQTYRRWTTGGEGSSEARIGLDSPFDNSWYRGYGVDLLFERGIDTNLRSVVARRSGNPIDRTVNFRPKADGINDFAYQNADDWSHLADELCRTVVNPGGTVTNAVRCR